MAEPIPKSGGDGSGGKGAGNDPKDVKNKTSADPKDAGTDPKKTKPKGKPFDPSQLGDEDFNKVFDDPRLFTHSRFKQLNEQAKQAKELLAAEKKREEARLKKEGKLSELNEKLTKERDDALAKANRQVVNLAITQEAVKQGSVDTEAVLKLINRENLTPDDDGNVEGVDKAVEALLTEKPYLKGEAGTRNIGSPTMPGATPGTQPRRFKHSQIQDPAFFKENEDEIAQAMAKGLIEHDL